jgi:DNA polymerase-3 subunit chi
VEPCGRRASCPTHWPPSAAHEQICIGWGQEPRSHDDLLINLQLTVPPFVGRFRRVAELVNQEPARLQALRESWRYYKQRGYAVEEHRIASV